MKHVGLLAREMKPDLLAKIRREIGLIRIRVANEYMVDECEERAAHYRGKGYRVALIFNDH